jgi:hypothetical protein
MSILSSPGQNAFYKCVNTAGIELLSLINASEIITTENKKYYNKRN